ncbi:phage tail protein [Streptomyces sp. NPDC054765]
MDPRPPAARSLALPAVFAHDSVVQAFAAAIGEAIAPAEHRLDNLESLFDPWRTPPAFLDWLIQITGARVEPGWTEQQRRTAIDLAPRLAAIRGTPAALKLEARLIHGWNLVVDDPGGAFAGPDQASRSRDGQRQPPAGRMLTVTLAAKPGEDQRALEYQLTRLVRAHCPAHLPFKAAVTRAS